MAGIIGYGAYIPRFRLRVEDIWDVWVNPVDTPTVIKERKGLTEKAVARWDEDSITMAIAAAKASLECADISADHLNAIFFGSCTNPYVSKAAVSIIAEALTEVRELMCVDCQFAAKSGTAALQICVAFVDAGFAHYALGIGSDALSKHVPPNDTLEYSASSGAAAFVIGKEKVIAEIEGMHSHTTQIPEFFRLDGERYIKHAASEDGEYLWGYRRYTKEAVEGYMKRFGCKPSDFTYVAISQPDGRLPLETSKEIGFDEQQIKPGLIATEIGDCGSASSLLSLEAILDQAKSDERILLISYGFGAGCDVLGLRTTNLLEASRQRKTYPSVKELINNKEYITYTQYLRQERKLIQEYI
ncbi:hydroxymethylglutaryl-CoA synthase [Chloroflexota bacterium]